MSLQPEHSVFVALGSNLGNRLETLKKALRRIGEISQTRLGRLSPIYETHPEGESHNMYLNMVAELRSRLSPHRLLAALLRIETALGRRRSGKKNEDRTIDLDILIYDARISASKTLTLPHPRMHRREFVLKPLADIAPDLIHPLLQKSMPTLLAHLGPSSVRRVYQFTHRELKQDA